MKTYDFYVVLSGTGDNPDEAWKNAVEGFHSDPGSTPISYSVIEEKVARFGGTLDETGE